MISENELLELGFSREQAAKLLGNKQFILAYRNKSQKDLASGMNEVEAAYGFSRPQTVKAIYVCPNFAKSNPFSALRNIIDTYKVARQQAIKAVLSFPQFAGYDHPRVLRDVMQKYCVTRQQAINAIFSYPQFASPDHSRVIRQAERLGKRIGLARSEVLEALVGTPRLAGLSQKRNAASIHAIRSAVLRTGSDLTNRELFNLYKKHYMNSPYPVKGSKLNEKRWAIREGKPIVSKMGKTIETRLNKEMRKRLTLRA